ncbi:MAG: hypothetical protein M3126_07355 [Candidatus Eremiobacteraeota bacterium]|nr:hypothetical protein [Candidatus Eremiobacteraeota bacterium]
MPDPTPRERLEMARKCRKDVIIYGCYAGLYVCLGMYGVIEHSGKFRYLLLLLAVAWMLMSCKKYAEMLSIKRGY